MIWTSLDTWILVIGALTAGSCGLLGTYLVLQRMSMMGDAISHAVLPGIAIAFLVTGSRSPAVMFAGAAALGLLTAVLSQALHRWGRVDALASMGVVFTSLFALGLLLIVRAADRVDLDPGCVLYGALEYAPQIKTSVFGFEIPQAALVMGTVALADLLFVLLLYHPLKVSAFDPALASTLGFRAPALYYGLMAMVAATTVAAFEAVGSILVVAMLIVPGATAVLLARRFGVVLLLAVLIAIAGAGLGQLGAVVIASRPHGLDLNIAASMVVATGGLFVLAFLFAPHHGVLSRLYHHTQLSLRIVSEDLLGLLYRLEERGRRESAEAVIDHLRRALGLGPILPALALRRLRRRHFVEGRGETLTMTPHGRYQARTLVRTHRLWETYLARHLQLPADHVHPTAMRLEHVTGADLREQLAADVEHAAEDPHGRPIPDDN